MRNEFFVQIMETLADNGDVRAAIYQIRKEWERGYQVGDQDVADYTILAFVPFAEYSTDHGQNFALAKAFADNKGCEMHIKEDLQTLVDEGMMDA